MPLHFNSVLSFRLRKRPPLPGVAYLVNLHEGGNLAPSRISRYVRSALPLKPLMASHRIGARLAGLSPEQFLAFIEEQAPLWSDAALRVAEEHAARLVEQPEWVLSEVLLSPDLAPHILAQLPTNAHAAKGTCRAWRRGWKETLKKRERARLLVIGGSSGGVRLNSLERYDPSTNEWEEETVAPMPTPRRYVRTAALDGKLYAAGGVSEADNLAAPNLVERYDLATNAWEAVTPMATARVSHAVAVLDGKLYAAGGHNDDAAGGHNDDEVGHTSYLTSVERYDPAANAWVGGGGADGGGAVYFRRGSARRQAVRCGRLQRW